MNKLVALRQRVHDLKAEARQLLAAVDEKTGLTDEQRTQVNALQGQIAKAEADVKAYEALIQMDEKEAPAAGSGARADVPEAGKKPWASLGEQLGAVVLAGRTHGRDTDPRLLAGPQGMNETIDAEGGFAVAPQFVLDILQRTYDAGEISSRCFSLPMTSRTMKLNAVDEDSRVDGSRWGGLRAYWDAEAGSYTPSKPKFRQMELNAHKLIGLCYLTDEIVEDAAALQAYVQLAFPQEFAFKIDEAIYEGSGAGVPLGIMKSGAVVTVAKDNNQTAKTITNTNVTNMYARMFARSRRSSCWLVNQDVEPQLYPLTLGSGTAVQLMYTPPGVNGNNGPYGLLLGRPVIPIEHAATLGTQGDIVLADFQQYLLAKKGDIQMATSIHVAFITGEQALRFTLRLDGQPMWKKPLTPKKGANTLSPFVALADRG